ERVARQEDLLHALQQAIASKKAADEYAENDRAMRQAPAQAAIIGAMHKVEGAFARAIERIVLFAVFALQNPSAQHRGEHHRDQSRNQDGDNDGKRKFMQQTADNAT